MTPEPTSEPTILPAEGPPRGYVRSRLFVRLFSVALPGLLAVVVVSLAALVAFEQLGTQMPALDRSRKADAIAGQLVIYMDDMVTNLDQLTVPGNQYNAMLLDKNRTKIAASLAQFDNLDFAFPGGTDNHPTTLSSKIKLLLQDLEQLNDPNLIDPSSRYALWYNELRPRVGDAQDDLKKISQDWNDQTTTIINNARQTFTLGRGGIVGTTLFAILASVLVAIWLTRRTMQPIQRLKEHMARVAVGDLTPSIMPAGILNTDELSALEKDYQHTLNMLRPLISRIQEDAAHISSSAAQISAAAAQQASGSGEQAAAITQVTVTVEELNQTAVQIAEAAASVAAAAEQALVSANRGQEAVRDSILGMAMIKSRVNDITARILALSEQSQRISEVIDLINTIAAQTHILALNAAVESAGAGEYGERFAVVAAEVKKLAQRSVTATKEVRAIIAQIQAATAAAVMATEEGLKETDRGVALAHQSGDANDDIISMVERTAQLANAISLATQQQRTASEQVVATMREVAEVTRQAAVSSQEASRAANELSTIASELRGVSQGFKITPPGRNGHDGSLGAHDLAGETLELLPAGGERA